MAQPSDCSWPQQKEGSSFKRSAGRELSGPYPQGSWSAGFCTTTTTARSSLTLES